MDEQFLPEGVDPPDFYVAAIGRSGSTLLCNWLASPPQRLVFVEPFFLRPANSRLLRIQLSDFDMAASDEEWAQRDESAAVRFGRLMAERLRGRRWALKEVLCEEHERVLDALRPAKVLITVRSIDDVALSFFEKHRAQGNLDRFSDEWVVRYCVEESKGLVGFCKLLKERGIPHQLVRYDEFSESDAARDSVARFVGWAGGGDTASHFSSFDRSFEIERHGCAVSGIIRARDDRDLGSAEIRLADHIVELCTDYQREFGFS